MFMVSRWWTRTFTPRTLSKHYQYPGSTLCNSKKASVSPCSKNPWSRPRLPRCGHPFGCQGRKSQHHSSGRPFRGLGFGALVLQGLKGSGCVCVAVSLSLSLSVGAPVFVYVCLGIPWHAWMRLTHGSHACIYASSTRAFLQQMYSRHIARSRVKVILLVKRYESWQGFALQ